MFQVSTTADSSILAICGGVLADLWAASGSYPWLTAAYLLGPILLGGLVIMVMDFRPRAGGVPDRLLRGARRLLTALGFERAYGWAKQRWLFRRADRALIAFALVGFVAAGSFLGWKIATGTGPQQRAIAGGAVATPFSLTAHNGQTVTADSFRDKYALVSFGYTFCPDVCPTTLNTLSVALDILGDRADNIVTAFITIDPQRDTVAVLRAYVANFNPHILGLTGAPEHIRTLAKAYQVYYARAPGGKPDDPDYLMEHSAGIYLIGPDGRIVQTFPHSAAAEDIAAAVKSVLPAAPVS
jgi:protein SCO1